MKPTNNIPAYTISQFTYDRMSHTLVAEASDLAGGTNGQLGGRCWNDSCDYGFHVTNPDTGVTVLFVEAGQVRDAEGDLLYEDFGVADTGLPQAKQGLRVRVYND